jgi:hypothetical protein
MDAALQGLLTAAAVRERCTVIGELAMGGETPWFRVNESRIGGCAELVADLCKRNYPGLDIPLHSRWRHFTVNGTDLWHHYRNHKLARVDSDAVLTRTAIDLVFVSVLLDAGAGPRWRYTEPVTGATLTRSEGLAAASVDLFFNGLARDEGANGWVVDSLALRSLTADKLAQAFQHTQSNPLLGMEGRLQLLRGLADALAVGENPDLSRPGDLFDVFMSMGTNGRLPVAAILREILCRFGSIWPSGLVRDGFNLGDCGLHRLLQTADDTNHIVPFHKLSQWLSYSLIELLRWGGINVTEVDGLTGLPEYRNGGLLIDSGVIEPVQSALLSQRLDVASEAVVEWRALTVFLLDRIADEVRTRLGKSRDDLPLCSVLQGGTWAAGRHLAAALRPDGSPPIDLAIDGTVF